MKTKEIQLFEFDELDEAVKAKVLEKNRHINTDYEWYDLTIGDWEEKLEGLGFNDPKVSFSGFYSQGDGASFTCKSVDVEKFLTAQKKKGQFRKILSLIKSGEYDVEVEIKRIDYHYSHENTVSVYVDIYPYNEKSEAAGKEEGELRGLITDVARDLMRDIYRDLETEFEELVSDEAVIDTIKANEYTFRANGVMENL